ncbi:MAG: hypothetical protein SGI73_14105 [Chloroflexota bacterium]|nr:hypothetical protein [Chloroflexota bacterium]
MTLPDPPTTDIAADAPPELPDTLALDFTDDELRTLLAFAKRRGFTNATSYLKQLVDIDAHKHDDDLPFMEDTPDEWVIDGLINGLRQALRGEGRPAREVLAELRAERDNE